MSLIFEAVLGAALSYGLAEYFAGIREENDIQTHFDVLTIGAAGGILGGAVLSMVDPAPSFPKTLAYVLGGLLIYDYFLFQ
jgi:hypothetical protein